MKRHLHAPRIGRRDFIVGTGALALGAGAGSLSGCSVVPRNPDVAGLYRYAPDIDPALRRPIVFIPGTLGSRLRVGRDGPFIWGGPGRLAEDPSNPEAARRVAHPIGQGTEPLAALKDDVRVDGVVRRASARVLFATVEEQVYDGLAAALNAGGYEFSRTREEEAARQGRNPGSLEYPYDWRRDIIEAARELDDFIERKARQIHAVRMDRYGRSPRVEEMRFDFVAHSMGALVLRWWLMHGAQDLPRDGGLPELNWAGARRAACVVTVAPPNLGSISAFDALVNGKEFGFLQPSYPPGLLGTHPSLYQLMPRARHDRVLLGGPDGPPAGDLYDAGLWEEHRWGLLDPAEDAMLSALMPDARDAAERRRRARAHLTRALKRAERFHAAIDRPGTPPRTDMFIVVGTGLDTPAAAVADPASGRVEVSVMEEGDGVVLRASALSEERQGGHEGGRRRPIQYRTVLLLPGEHVMLTRNPVFADNLLYWLLDAPRRRLAVASATIPPRAPRPDG